MFLLKRFFLRFFRVFFSPYISLLIGQLFKVGVQRFASNKGSKNMLKTLANITLRLLIFSKLDSIEVSLLRTLTCPFPVLAL